MWKTLWDDFECRTARITMEHILDEKHPSLNAVDRTVVWQLRGKKPLVDHAIAETDLQLPELYSGTPWKYGRSGWIAFVTVNPGIDTRESYPTRRDRQLSADESLIQFFEDRFAPAPIHRPVHGDRRLKYGRKGSGPKHGPVKWCRKATKNADSLRAVEQHTWDSIDAATAMLLDPFLGDNSDRRMAPLGRAAAIIDAVPWKFSNWGHKDAKSVWEDLLTEGMPYLIGTLQAHPPSVIIACGSHVRQVMSKLSRRLESGCGDVGAAVVDAERCSKETLVLEEGREIPWWGIAHPAARSGESFWRHIVTIANDVRTVIRDAVA